MSKVDDNKKQKESTIVQQAGLAKGTFYLYFQG